MSGVNDKVWLLPIASGSSGNASLVGDEDGNIFLVDCGISHRKFLSHLKDSMIDIEKIRGIFITHEHIDHIRGVATLIKKQNIPVFASAGTMQELRSRCGIADNYDKLLVELDVQKPINFYDFEIRAFKIPHDSVDPVAFTFTKYNKKISICTDFGIVTEDIKKNLSNSNLLLIEANHDEKLLEVSKYPYKLKKRILGAGGHISNENVAGLIGDIWHKELRFIYLAHLSDENNFGELAIETVKNELNERKIDFVSHTEIIVANKDGISKMAKI